MEGGVKRGRGRPRKHAPHDGYGVNPRAPVPVVQPPVSNTADEHMAASMESGSTSAFPDKNLVEIILDKLQKKDKYGVFSKPVDLNEVPDYLQVIKNPMDFGTIRKKLHDGVYATLDELEIDVILICSNAMLYNAADTYYYRLGQTIQDLARRDISNLKNEGKVVKRGRLPSNKNPSSSSAEDAEPQPDLKPRRGRPPTSASETGSSGYNLRKAPPVAYYKHLSGNSSTNNDENNYTDEWNNDFPAHILREDMKNGKKNVAETDVGRRDTYNTSSAPMSSSEESSHKRLVPVGFQLDPSAYARSLERFAGELGPVVWEVASKKLKPDGPSSGRQE